MLLDIGAEEVLKLLEEAKLPRASEGAIFDWKSKCFFGTFGRTNAASSEGGAKDENLFLRGVEPGRISLPTAKGKDAWQGLGMGT